jgi:3-(methylthio)propanoyl-CoA dehydrogenase
MSTPYRAPLQDIRFVLEHVAPLAALRQQPGYAHADDETVVALLEEAGRFSEDAVAPTNRDGDTDPARLVDGEVVLPASFGKVYQQYVAAGWGALAHPAEFGGGAFPLVVANAVQEMLASANLSWSLCPLLTQSAVHLLARAGSDEQQKTYLPNLVSGAWTATMAMTEPHAGSDVGAVTTRARPEPDGTYRLTGQKIFITYGEHQLTDNIVHLVLARLPDAPPGTGGLSLFLVPKLLVDGDGAPHERNDVGAVSLEHKLGIHGSPTCVLALGEGGDGAVGFMVGEPNTGMRHMFTMMNHARLAIGVQGVAIAERAYQAALAYARERRQGRRPGGAPDEQSAIIAHPDVRRMLLMQKACIEAMRCVCYANAHALDLAHGCPDPTVRGEQQKIADLLTPLSKAWCTDLGVELTSLAVQVHGGMGYIEETGVAQLYRDARITPIYEGTNGIQALDLIGRKLRYDDGAFVRRFLAEMRSEIERPPDVLASVRGTVLDGLTALERCTEWMLTREASSDDVAAGASPYLRMFGTLVGAWLLARSAARAHGLGAAGTYDTEFLHAKVAAAGFFATHLVPQVHALAASVTAGAEQLTHVEAW